jgi:hypothetical protein
MSKTTPTVLLIVSGALALASAPLSAGERIRPGQWEFTIIHPGSEPNVFKHCVTADEATSVNGDTKTARAYAEKKAAGRCAITAYDVHGDSVSYAMKCGEVAIRMTAVYHGDTSEGEQTSKKGSEPEVVSHVKARRLGDCP